MNRTSQTATNAYRASLKSRALVGALNQASRVALSRFEAQLPDAAAVNDRLLASILTRNAGTHFGRAYRFANLSGADLVNAYRHEVPLRHYDDYAAFVERIAAGEANVLTRDAVELLAGSAGTTDVPKRLPTTRRARRKFAYFLVLLQRAVIGRAAPLAMSPARGISIMSLYMPPAPDRVGVASLPNAGMRSIRRSIPLLWSSPPAVFGLADQASALYLHALFGLAEPGATSVSAVFAPHLTGWFDTILRERERLLEDLASGRLSSGLVIDDNERRRIEACLHADPERATQVRRALEHGAEGLARRLWPQLQYLMGAVSGSFAVYQPRLAALAGEGPIIFSPTHASSEAVIGVSLDARRPGEFVLATGSAAFEFIPVESADAAQPDTVGPGELEPGQNYEVVLTNTAGLYRYRLGDVIRVTGVRGTAPVFQFLYRRGSVIDLAGEKTTEWHTAKAVRQVIGGLVDYSVTGRINGDGAQYTVYAELDDPARYTAPALDQLAGRLDVALGEANPYYRSSGREVGRLAPVQLKIVRCGSFSRLLGAQLAEPNGTINQVKVPRALFRADQIRLLEDSVLISCAGQQGQFHS